MLAAAAFAVLWLSSCTQGGPGQPVESATRSDRSSAGVGRPGLVDAARGDDVRPFPQLAVVPARPPVRDGAEQDRIFAELVADRAGAARISAEIGGRALSGGEADGAGTDPGRRTAPVRIGSPPPRVAASVRAAERGVVPGGPLFVPALQPPPAAGDVLPGNRGATVRFASGSADLDAVALDLIDAVAEAWRRRGGTVRIEAHGRAGPPARPDMHVADLELSVQRANAVTGRLLRGGVPKPRIVIGAVVPGTRLPGLPASSGAAETERVEVYLSN